MTKVFVESNDNFINKVSIKGHSCYAESGSDIVCSSISGAVEVTIRMLEKVEGVIFDINEDNASIIIEVTQPNSFTNDCLGALLGFLNDLSLMYEKFLKIYR